MEKYYVWLHVHVSIDKVFDAILNLIFVLCTCMINWYCRNYMGQRYYLPVFRESQEIHPRNKDGVCRNQEGTRKREPDRLFGTRHKITTSLHRIINYCFISDYLRFLNFCMRMSSESKRTNRLKKKIIILHQFEEKKWTCHVLIHVKLLSVWKS